VPVSLRLFPPSPPWVALRCCQGGLGGLQQDVEFLDFPMELLDFLAPGVQFFRLGLDLGLQGVHQGLGIIFVAINGLVIWLEFYFPTIPLGCWLSVGQQFSFAYASAYGIDADT